MPVKPRILITNDDGIQAPGLQALVEGLYQSQLYDLRVGAPETERSGSSHALISPVTVTLFSDGSVIGLPAAVLAYAASGFPADAVRLAFLADIFEDGWVPDVVVSGMNRGLNAGRAISVSGTVGAAREGAHRGAKALAVSLHSVVSNMRQKTDYASAVQDLLPVLNWFIAEERWPSYVLLNVNIPRNASMTNGGQRRGLTVVPQGRSYISTPAVAVDAVQSVVHGAKAKTKKFKFYFNLEFDPEGNEANDDLIAAAADFMTLTPLPIGTKDDVQLAMELLCQWRQTHKHPTLEWNREFEI